MADNATLRVAFTTLLNVVESQQKQIDALLERQLSIEDAAKTVVEDFLEAQEESASRLSNATQYKIAEKADIYAVLRSQYDQIFPD